MAARNEFRFKRRTKAATIIQALDFLLHFSSFIPRCNCSWTYLKFIFLNRLGGAVIENILITKS